MDTQNTSMNKQKMLFIFNSPTQQKTLDFNKFKSNLKFVSPGNSYNKQEYSPYVIKSGCFSYAKQKTFNFLTQNKRKVNNSKIYTPSPNTDKSQKLSDRFIPMNKGINLMEKFNLANRYDELDENKNITNVDNNNLNENNNKYNEILKQNVLNDNLNSSIFSNKMFGSSNNSTSQNLRAKIFSFKTENKPKNDFYHSIINNQKDNEINSNEERKINPKPYKILRAEELSDDFYLNLVDWSAKNDIAVGLGNKVQLWSTNQTQSSILCSYRGEHEKVVTSVMWNQDGNLLAVGNSQGIVEIYDINKQTKIESLEGHEARVGVVAWNDNIISSGSKDCTILSRDIRCNNNNSILVSETNNSSSMLNNNNLVMKYIGHIQEVCGLKWSFDHSQLASGGNDNYLMVWDLRSTKPLMCNNSHSAAVKAIAWSPHQHNILVSGGGTADRTIRFWNTSTFTPINKIDTGSQVCNLVFSKTVNELVSTHGFSLNQIILWKMPSMNKIATLTGHTFRVLYLGLSPDGQNIVTGAGDQTLRFWNLFPPFKMDSISSLFASNKDIR